MYRAPKKKDYLYPETQNICPIELLVVVAAELLLLLLLLLSSSANYKFNMTSANSASSKIFWGMDPPAGGPQDPQARATICKQDHGWIQKAAFETPDGSVVTVKAGNKLYGLTASTKSDYNPDRIYATELGLFRKYRYTKITNIHTSKQANLHFYFLNTNKHLLFSSSFFSADLLTFPRITILPFICWMPAKIGGPSRGCCWSPMRHSCCLGNRGDRRSPNCANTLKNFAQTGMNNFKTR